MSLASSTSPAPDRPAQVAAPVGAGRAPYEAEQPNRWLRGHVPGEVGIWIFIVGDMTLYAVLFGSFMVDRSKAKGVFDASAATLHVTFGTVNTLLLLTSSLFVALGVRAYRERIMPAVAPWLFRGALLCAAGFAVNKFFEYRDLLMAGHMPTDNTFYTYYYVLTGIHLTHLLAGMGVLTFLLRLSQRQERKENDVRAVESAASFWHVVDLLWIVLFPLLYLVR